MRFIELDVKIGHGVEVYAKVGRVEWLGRTREKLRRGDDFQYGTPHDGLGVLICA